MPEDTLLPEKIWIITEETSETSNTTSGSRSGDDIGGRLGEQTNQATEVVVTNRKLVEVAKLKKEMTEFLRAMQQLLDEAEQPNSKMQLDEVQLSVEINGEGQVSLFGIGGKVGNKGGMTFKFKRK
jgi:hypothetical protein